MEKNKNNICSSITENNSFSCAADDDDAQAVKEVINYLNQLQKSITISPNKANELLDDYNMKLVKSNSQDYSMIKKIIKNNINFTPKDQQEIYWNKFIEIVDSMTKTNDVCKYPELPFGQSLDDSQFLELFQWVVNYICFSHSIEEINNIKEQLKDFINNNNIFGFPNVIKNLKEDGLLSFLMAETEEERDESLELMKISNCTLTPFINLTFNRNNINYDLNKKELENILTSNILLKFYSDNLRNFIPKYNEIIKDNNDLKKYIISSITNYNIYFCELSSNLMAVTIYTGDVYLRTQYLQEYFENKMKDVINEDNSIIIREKIVLNLKHEMNHSLIREIDVEKKNNFFLKSQNANSKTQLLVFKDKFNKNKNYKYLINESGNCFDYAFYKGYYFNHLFKNEANFFLEVKNMNDENEYNNNFDEMISNTPKYRNKLNSINKFKKGYKEFPRCFKSKMLEYNLDFALNENN